MRSKVICKIQKRLLSAVKIWLTRGRVIGGYDEADRISELIAKRTVILSKVILRISKRTAMDLDKQYFNE